MFEGEDACSEPAKKNVVTRLAVALFMAGMLLVMPTLAVVAALDAGNGALYRDVLSPPAALWVLWGVFSFWIIFDTSRVLKILNASVEPLGPEEVALTLAGIANLIVLAICSGFSRF